jgi:LytS/YehU family sensor histidine kinase
MLVTGFAILGLAFCIFVMPFTQYANEQMNKRDYTMMTLYVFFMLLAIVGVWFGI